MKVSVVLLHTSINIFQRQKRYAALYLPLICGELKVLIMSPSRIAYNNYCKLYNKEDAEINNDHTDKIITGFLN